MALALERGTTPKLQACEWSVAVKGKNAANPDSKTKPNFRIWF
jgi:hypothetical protein